MRRILRVACALLLLSSFAVAQDEDGDSSDGDDASVGTTEADAPPASVPDEGTGQADCAAAPAAPGCEAPENIFANANDGLVGNHLWTHKGINIISSNSRPIR